MRGCFEDNKGPSRITEDRVAYRDVLKITKDRVECGAVLKITKDRVAYRAELKITKDRAECRAVLRMTKGPRYASRKRVSFAKSLDCDARSIPCYAKSAVRPCVLRNNKDCIECCRKSGML